MRTEGTPARHDARSALLPRLTVLALLWLAGFGIRATILAVPPLIPAIHRTLGLNEVGITALTNLPILLLALAAVPSGMLIARLGPVGAAALGLALAAVAGALRGAGQNLAVLFAMTVAMGGGVALAQGALPALARGWFPARVGLATAVYSNGLLVGEVLPTSLTGLALLPLLGQRWPLALAFWSGPVLVGGVLFAVAGRWPSASQPPSGRPQFRAIGMWRMALALSFASAAYFGANTFVPDYLRAVGHGGLTDAALATLNLAQLPASVLVMVVPERLVGRRFPLVATGAAIAAACVLLVLTPGPWTVVWVGVIGFSTSLTLILTLAIPALLARDGSDVHRLTAGLFTVNYGCTFVWAMVGSAIWDAYRLPAASFLTLAAGGVIMVALSATSPLRATRPEAAIGGT